MSVGEWKVWRMDDVKAMSVSGGVVRKPALSSDPHAAVLVVDGNRYDVPLSGLDWVDGDELTVTRVVDGDGDLYLRFRKKSQGGS